MRTVPTRMEFHEGNEGVSRNTGSDAWERPRGYLPAFRDTDTGRTVIARYADGGRAPVHVLERLPEDWIQARDANGKVTALKGSILAGFVRDGDFRTREEIASDHADDAA